MLFSFILSLTPKNCLSFLPASERSSGRKAIPWYKPNQNRISKYPPNFRTSCNLSSYLDQNLAVWGHVYTFLFKKQHCLNYVSLLGHGLTDLPWSDWLPYTSHSLPTPLSFTDEIQDCQLIVTGQLLRQMTFQVTFSFHSYSGKEKVCQSIMWWWIRTNITIYVCNLAHRWKHNYDSVVFAALIPTEEWCCQGKPDILKETALHTPRGTWDPTSVLWFPSKM